MDNGEVLDAFEEFLQADSYCRKLMELPALGNAYPTVVPLDFVKALGEFAKAIDPVPLEEATEQEIKAFLHDHRKAATPVRPLPLSAAYAKARLEKALAELRHDQYYRLPMECFRVFRRSVLKSRRRP